MATGFHLFPFRTEKLSPFTPMVLRRWESRQSPFCAGRDITPGVVSPAVPKGPAGDSFFACPRTPFPFIPPLPFSPAPPPSRILRTAGGLPAFPFSCLPLRFAVGWACKSRPVFCRSLRRGDFPQAACRNLS